jgi:membrane protein
MSSRSDPYGRDATHPLQIPLKGWRQVAQRVWVESARDNFFVIAAGCAFFAIFAIFPVLSGLISFYGLISDPATIKLHLPLLGLVLPAQAYDMVTEQAKRLTEVSSSTLGWSLAVSIGLALWSVTSSTYAIFCALNIAYEETERRSMLHFYLRAFVFAVAGIFGGVVALLAVVYVPLAFAYTGHSADFARLVGLARWPVLAIVALVLFACFYRYGPSRRSAQWRWVIPGSAFATIVWLIASAGFSLYVSHFADYDKIYGSLGAAIVLLFWLYLTFYIFLFGAEINAELELQTTQDTTSGKPKPAGERGAFVADHVAGGPEGALRPDSLAALDLKNKGA